MPPRKPRRNIEKRKTDIRRKSDYYVKRVFEKIDAKKGQIIQRAAQKLPKKYKDIILLSINPKSLSKLEKFMEEWDRAIQDRYDSAVDVILPKGTKKGLQRLIEGELELREPDSKINIEAKMGFSSLRLNSFPDKISGFLKKIEEQIKILEEGKESIENNTDASGRSKYGLSAVERVELEGAIEEAIDVLAEKREQIEQRLERMKEIFYGKK